MNAPSLAFMLSMVALSCAVAEDADRPFRPDQAVRVSGITTGSALNVRRGPGSATPVVAKLAPTRGGLTIIACNDTADWCRISDGRAPLGWVAARYLARIATPSTPATPRFSEAARLSRASGTVLKPGGTATIGELPAYLLGDWDVDARACAQPDSDTRVTVQKNGLRIGAATARFKTAIFRDEGYDLTTLLMEEQDVPNAVPQRALYRLEPDARTLGVSGDVLEANRLRRCRG